MAGVSEEVSMPPPEVVYPASQHRLSRHGLRLSDEGNDREDATQEICGVASIMEEDVVLESGYGVPPVPVVGSTGLSLQGDAREGEEMAPARNVLQPEGNGNGSNPSGGGKKFRLNATDLFLTYPHCDMDPAEVERELRRILKWFDKAAICRESHANGLPHLHAIVHLSKRCNLHSPTSLDIRDGRGRVFHGNYQPARNASDCLNYVEKDRDVRYCGGTMEDVQSVLRAAIPQENSRKRKLAEALGELMTGKTLGDLLRDPNYVSLAIIQQRNLLAAKSILTTEMFLKKSKKWLTASGAPGSASALIAEWLNKNLMKPRPFRSPQLYLYGPTGIGKTSFIAALEPAVRIYYLPMLEDWYDDYDDGKFDLVVLDEFNSQKTLQFMNQLLDGQVLPLKQKGRQVVKRDNLPVVILSNYSPDECYGKTDPSRKATFLSRLHVVFSCENIRVSHVFEDLGAVPPIAPGPPQEGGAEAQQPL